MPSCPAGVTNPALAPILLARALRQETKSQLKKMGEHQEMKNAMLEELVTETADQLNKQVRSWGSTPTTPGSVLCWRSMPHLHAVLCFAVIIWETQTAQIGLDQSAAWTEIKALMHMSS